ncbi:hypothetical protein K402DRAFT_391684 [Aulographum hederae CBS 113979]|uniref:Zn(2)-C6 fungal-type domain-containing protein n=1 Tax=Aulographum hederae CBS 113979 TaxID=1176131 RepID=A0A6G1H5W6_9PEZI|nr:hypothetical protein K402DRAFT_391684 [Aulographum hederae CBS 113979]
MPTNTKPTKRRAAGPRRKTGCYTCRSRHLKCDEEKPQCGNCARKGYDCVQAESFISATSAAPKKLPKHPRPTNSTPKDAPSRERDQTSHSLSTWDVFNLSPSSLPRPLPAGATASDTVDILDQETVELLRAFQGGIATWMDLFDHSMSYQREGSRLALRSTLIRESICSISSKQLELVGNRSLWAPVAARRYGKSLRLLIDACADGDADQQEVLMATILLCSVELLAAPESDHKRHLFGAATLVKSRKIDASSTGLDRASFWLYARLDLAMGLMNECPTVLSSDDWNASWTEHESNEDNLGNHMLWLCSRIVNFVFGTHPSASERENGDAWRRLMEAVDAWFERIPAVCMGSSYGVQDQFGFEEWWFPVPAAAAAIATYHEAKLLLPAEHRQRTKFEVPFPGHGDPDSRVQDHASKIGSIGISKSPDAALVQAVQLLYFAAKYIHGLDRKARLWGVLSRIETNLGFHTASRLKQLRNLTETT